MTRADFLFTIGYQGSTAVVDKNAKRRYGSASTQELLETGLYKPAFCSAIFSGDDAEVNEFLARYRAITGNTSITIDALKRLYGVFDRTEHVQKVLLV